MATTVSVGNVDGFSFLIPNVVVYGEGFYVSYNDYDISIHGSDTTALVPELYCEFFVLNGDHRDGYANLMSQGFDACFEYFLANIDRIGKYSSKPDKKR